MPRRAKGPRLYLDEKRSTWVIRDGPHFIRTGCPERQVDRASQLLAEYIANKHRPQKSSSPRIADVLLAYTTDIVPAMRTARNVSYNIGSLMPWWSGKLVSDINRKSCQAYAATKTPAAARVHLKVLRSAVNHWHAEHGPLAAIPTFWQPPEPPPRERWLTRSEAARLLWAARRTRHLVRFILLGLYTGSRPGVLVQLRWDWIDFGSGIMRRKAIGEAERSLKRRTPVKLGRRILAHLRRWRRQDMQDRAAIDVRREAANEFLARVQLAEAASRHLHPTHIVHYDGRPIAEPHGSWDSAVRRAGLKGVTPHTLRHTRATWLMQAGIDPWQAAGALGMSLKTLERVYGHHHPAFQAEAAEV